MYLQIKKRQVAKNIGNLFLYNILECDFGDLYDVLKFHFPEGRATNFPFVPK
jgi:hypothetical protein